MRTNVDDSIGDSSRREDDILGLVAPQLLACAGIERIEQVVLRTHVVNPISDRGRGADSVPGRVTPYHGPRSVVKSIQVVVPGADVDDSFCYYWGGLNTRRCGVAPEGITSTGVKGIERVIQGADIDYSVDESRCRVEGAPCRVTPDLLACTGFKRVQVMVSRADIDDCADNHGRGLDDISCWIRPGSSQSRNLGGKDHSTRRSVLRHPNLLWISGCQRFLSNLHMSYIYYILVGIGFLVTRLSHLHHIFALVCYFPDNPLRCICSRSNSAGARGLTPPSAHAWPIKSKPSCSPCAISEGSFVLSIFKQFCRCSIASSSF